MGHDAMCNVWCIMQHGWGYERMNQTLVWIDTSNHYHQHIIETESLQHTGYHMSITLYNWVVMLGLVILPGIITICYQQWDAVASPIAPNRISGTNNTSSHPLTFFKPLSSPSTFPHLSYSRYLHLVAEYLSNAQNRALDCSYPLTLPNRTI